MANEALLYGNGNNVRVSNFTVDGTLKDDATWTFTAYDANGEAISGATGITMDYTGTSGEYIGVIASTVQLTRGTIVKIIGEETTYGCRFVAKWPVEERTPQT